MKKILVLFSLFFFAFLFFAPLKTYAACTTTVVNSSNPTKMTTDQDIFLSTQIPTNGSSHSIQIKPVNADGSLGNNIYQACVLSLFLNTTSPATAYDIPYHIPTPGNYVVEIKSGCFVTDGTECTSGVFTINNPPPVVPPPTNVFDCAHRSPECSDLTKYPISLCKDSGTANQTCNPSGSNVNCPMTNCTSLTNCTYSCAYNKDQPPQAKCQHEGETRCSNALGGGDTCCSNEGLVCKGSTNIVMGTGTCVKQDPSLNGCVTCPVGTWNGTQCTGNPTAGLSVNCGTTQTCVMGQGCVAPPPGSPPGVNYGGAFGGGATTFSCGNGINAVWTLSCIFPLLANLIYWLLLFAGTVAIFLIILAGIRLTTSGGDPKTVLAGRNILTFAIAGLVLILISFFILNFIGDVTGLACIKPSHAFSPTPFQSCL